MSEYAPGGSKPRMTNAKIRKLQNNQQEATRIANKKIADAKKSDEWKKEQAILNSLEDKLDNDKLIVKGNSRDVSKKHLNKQKKLSLWKKIISWFK